MGGVVLAGPLVVLTLGAIPFLGVSILGAFVQNLPLVLSFYLPLLLVGAILGPLWEEPGWRGFALPRLQQQYGPLAGTAILGVLWGLWHLPGFFGGWLGELSLSSLSASLLGITAFAFILTWAYNHTRGSLLIMILLHSAFNAASAFGGQILPADMPETVRALVFSGWIPAATYTACAILILLFTRGSLSYHPEAN